MKKNAKKCARCGRRVVGRGRWHAVAFSSEDRRRVPHSTRTGATHTVVGMHADRQVVHKACLGRGESGLEGLS